MTTTAQRTESRRKRGRSLPPASVGMRGWSGLGWLGVALLLVLPACGGDSNSTGTTPSSSTPKRTVVTKNRNKYPEPKPDMNRPKGTPNPAFVGTPSTEAGVVNTTGTYGGTFIYSARDEIETFNPVDPKGATSQEMRTILFSRLVSYSNGGWEHVPELATKWEVSADNRTWTFTIRKGILWSDGQPLTMEDVKFSFDAVFHPEIANSIKDGFRNVDGELPTYRVIDEQRIAFTTPKVDSQFLTHIGNVAIIPKHKWGAHLQAKNPTILQQMTNSMDFKDMVGTGPFVLKNYLPAEKVVFERNPYYWKVDARGERLPYLDKVVIALVKDSNVEWQKFEAGEFHAIEDISVDHFTEAEKMESLGKIKLFRLGVHLNTYWLCFNLYPEIDPNTNEPYVPLEKQHWFHKRDFRHALNHAIDRNTLVKSALSGRGEAIWSAFSQGNKLWYHEGTPRYEYDPEKANALLDGLGWTERDSEGYRIDDRGNTISFQLNTNLDNLPRQQIGTLIKEMWRKVGVKVAFKPIAFNDLVTSLQDSHRWDVIILGWGSGVPPDPANGKNITTSSGRLHAWHPQQKTPATEWEARVDELMGMMDQELKYETRKKYNDEIQELIARECPIVYMVSPNAYAAAKPTVGNVWPSVLRPQTTWNLESLFIQADAQ